MASHTEVGWSCLASQDRTSGVQSRMRSLQMLFSAPILLQICNKRSQEKERNRQCVCVCEEAGREEEREREMVRRKRGKDTLESGKSKPSAKGETDTEKKKKTQPHTHTRMHAHTDTQTHTHAQTQTHTHTDTHRHTNSLSPLSVAGCWNACDRRQADACDCWRQSGDGCWRIRRSPHWDHCRFSILRACVCAVCLCVCVFLTAQTPPPFQTHTHARAQLCLSIARAGLLAQGFTAFDAAVVGACLHAQAGDSAALDGGERGMLPSDLLPHIRRLVNPTRRTSRPYTLAAGTAWGAHAQ